MANLSEDYFSSKSTLAHHLADKIIVTHQFTKAKACLPIDLHVMNQTNRSEITTSLVLIKSSLTYQNPLKCYKELMGRLPFNLLKYFEVRGISARYSRIFEIKARL